MLENRNLMLDTGYQSISIQDPESRIKFPLASIQNRRDKNQRLGTFEPATKANAKKMTPFHFEQEIFAPSLWIFPLMRMQPF
jgi:hypothetical protein